MNRFLKVTLIAFACLFAVASLQAATVTWVGPGTDWLVGSNWDTTYVPGSSDITDAVYINTLTNTPVLSGAGGTIGQLQIGRSTGSGYMTIQTGGSLLVNGEIVAGLGAGNTGTLEMTGGTLTKGAGGNMHFGWDYGTGEFLMSGDSVYNQSDAGVFIGGSNGDGTVTLTDTAQFLATTTVSIVGIYGAATGELNVNTGTTFQSGELVVGQEDGVGTVNITGGNVNLGRTDWYGWEASLDIGRWTGGNGTVNVSGGNLNVLGRTNIGNETATGSLVLSGTGKMTTTAGGLMRNYGYYWGDGGDIYVGASAYWDGANIGGGTGYVTVKDTAQLICAGQFQVGIHGGNGTFTVGTGADAPVVSIAGSINMGNGSGAVSGASIGHMIMNSGTVTSADVVRLGAGAGVGTMDMYGGTVNTQALAIADGGSSTGTMNMSAGIVNVQQWMNIGGWGGNGTLNMTGGTINVAGTGGWDGWGTGAGTATINMSGDSKITISASTYWATMLGAVQWDGWGASNPSGTVTLSDTAQIVSPVGWLAGHVWGGINGNHNANASITLNDSSRLELGFLSLGDGIYNDQHHTTGDITINDTATLKVGSINVGTSGGHTTMTMNGGTAEVTGGWAAITVGSGATGLGTVTINNGTVTAPAASLFLARLGGTATWTQNGGSTTVSYVDMGEGSSNSTINLNGGTFAASYINGSYYGGAGPFPASSTINFGGGTLKPLAETDDFLMVNNSPNFHLYSQTGGAVIDTNGFAVGIRPNIEAGTPSGGLTKLGIGRLTLYGPQGYTGATTVTTGILDMPGAATWGTSSLAVAANAEFDRGLNGVLGLSALNLAADSTVRLTVAGTAPAAGDAIVANVGASGTMTLPTSGAANLDINPSGRTFANGTYTVFTYDTHTGGGLANLNVSGPRATITKTVGATSTTVNFAGVTLMDLTWDNGAGTDWSNVATDNHWVDGSFNPQNFRTLDTVRFYGATPTTINVVGQVHPLDIFVAGDYTLQGTGRITGVGTTLSVESGTLTLTNTGGNNFTGDVFVPGAALNINRNDQLGVNNTINLIGGSLTAAGAWTMANGNNQNLVASNSYVTVPGAYGAASATGSVANITLTGGTTVMSTGVATSPTTDWVRVTQGAGSSSAITIDAASWTSSISMVFGGAGSTTTLSMDNGAVLTSTREIQLGNGGNLTATLSNASLVKSGPNFLVGYGGPGTATVTLNAGTTLEAAGDELYVGYAGGHGVLNINDATVTVAGWANLGREGYNVPMGATTAVITMNGASTFTVGHEFRLGVWGGTGTMIVNGGTLNTGTIDSWAKIGDQGVGYLELNGTSTFTNKDAIDIGEGNAQGHGKVVVQGQATMTTTNSGIWVGNAAGALGELEIKDHGTVNSLNNELEVPWAGTGILTVGDGLATSDANLNCMMILLGWDAASTSGTVNLKTGGTISTNYFYTGSAGIGHAAVNFDGGVLKALQNNANFITNTGVADFQLNVLAGGAKINSNGFNIAITEPLRNGIVGTDGGLTKSGVGTLTLPVKDIYAPWTQTYNGPTVVTGGALVVGAGTTMATTGITLSGGGNMTVNTSHALTSTLTTLSLGAGSTLSIGLPSEATVGGEIVTNAMNLVATTNLYLTPNGGTVDPAGYDVFAYTSKTGTVADLAVALNPAYHAHIAPGDVTDSGTAIHVGITSDAVDLTWNATPTGDWDVNVTSDWLDPSLASVAFLNLDRVHFTAATTGSTANIVGTVQPGSIDATGGTVQTLAGTGGIVGEGTTLSVTGATLNVVNTGVNFFTGDVTVSGAGSVLNFTPSTALGLHNTITVDTGALNASADWTMANGASQDLVAIGGTVTVAGTLNAATRVDTTANITAVATSTVTVGGNVNLANAAGSTASLTVDNSTMTVGGHLYGGFANGSSVALAVTSGTLTTGTTAPEWVQLGYVAGSNADVTLTDGTMANNQNFAMVYGGATGTLTMTGWSTLSAVGQIRLNAGGDNTISMSGNSAVNCNNEVFGGLWGGNSTLTMSDNASILAGSLADFGAGNLGLGWQGGKITVDMSGNSTMRSGFMGYWGRDAGSVVNLTMTGSSKVGSTWNEMRFGSNGGTATIVMDGDNPADPVTFGNWVSGADCWYINIGEDAGSTGNLTMHNSSLVTTSYDLNFASTGASSTVLMDGNAAIYVGGELKVGNGGNAVGSMTVGSTTGTAIVSVGAHMRIGYNSSTGTLNIGPGANIGVNQWLQIGNVDAGADNLALTSYVNQTGGTITKNAVGGTYVMIGRGTNAVWTISDGLADIRGLASMGNRGASGTLNLNGGVFSIGAIQAGFEADAAAIMRINFNGGTLKVNTLSDIVPSGGSWFVTKYASADALITIADAGATIDTSGVDCHIDVPIVEAVAATTGGLDKEGLGQLELTVSPTYTGDTIVNAGGLKVPSLTTSPNIYVADTATLTAGSIVSETLTIGGGPYTFAAAAASSTPIGVPEPSTIVMLVLAGLGALLAWRRK